MQRLRVAVPLGRGVDTEASRSAVMRAIDLYDQSLVDLIVPSGRYSFVLEPRATPDHTEAGSMAQIALDAGLPAEKVIAETRSRDTAGNMAGTRHILELRGLHEADIAIVTIPWVRLRAWMLARRIFPRRYNLCTIRSQYRPAFRERLRVIAHETIILIAVGISLVGVRRGDIAEVQKRLQLWHPGYKLRIHSQPPINLLGDL